MKRALPVVIVGALVIAGSVAQPRAADPVVDEHTAVHVLNRITFGARPGDLARVQQMGIAKYIDEQLHPERLADPEPVRRLRDFETLELGSRDIAHRYEAPAIQARLQKRREQGDKPVAPSIADERPRPNPEQQRANLPLVELSEQKIVRAVYSDRQLEEVLTDFWFNHFNVDARKGPTRFMLTEYERDVIRPHVLGKFRDLLDATAKSPAMLFYLDNWMSADPNGVHQNRAVPMGRGFVQMPMRPRPAGKQRPTGLNENYGRELLELHTLGVDAGYTQRDVTEVARAFTGWTIETPRLGGGYRFNPAVHDTGEKVVLGHHLTSGGQYDGEQVLDILASHPATARFISTKLARRFVSDTPPASLVDRMASTFTRTHGDLRAVMTTLLTSPEFLAPDSERTKVKNPFEFVVSALRATNADVQDARPIVRAVQQLGMPLYQCQPPTGYKDSGDTWVNTGALVSRMNLALMFATGQLPGVHVPETASADSLVAGPLSETTRATIAKASAPPQAMALALGSPEFQRR